MYWHKGGVKKAIWILGYFHVLHMYLCIYINIYLYIYIYIYMHVYMYIFIYIYIYIYPCVHILYIYMLYMTYIHVYICICIYIYIYISEPYIIPFGCVQHLQFDIVPCSQFAMGWIVSPPRLGPRRERSRRRRVAWGTVVHSPNTRRRLPISPMPPKFLGKLRRPRKNNEFNIKMDDRRCDHGTS